MSEDIQKGSFDPVAYINEPSWQLSRLGLDRIRQLLARLGNPQDSLHFVHVAGTNGKGSTCAYLASMLSQAGLRPGLFTSPYIFDFSERIKVDGVPIDPEELRDITWLVREHAEAMAEQTGEHPTEFELMCAVAFVHFAREKCPIVVCEVGLGGRLDSTNVIDHPEVCVITRIGLDHTDILGEDLGTIAAEKAAIIKPGASVVTWPQEDPGAAMAIRRAARACDDELRVVDLNELAIEPIEDGIRHFRYKGKPFETRMLAAYQPANCALAIEAAWALKDRGWPISEGAISEGIARTRWPGRFELVVDSPIPIIIDGGHNPQGARALAESLCDAFPDRQVVFIMGVLADKGYEAMVEAVMALAKAFICIDVPNPRTLAATDLARVIREMDGHMLVEVASDPREALERAREIASPDDVICSFGSLYSVASMQGAIDAKNP